MTTTGCLVVGSARGSVMSTCSRSGCTTPRGGNFGRAVGTVARDVGTIVTVMTHQDVDIARRGIVKKGNASAEFRWQRSAAWMRSSKLM